MISLAQECSVLCKIAYFPSAELILTFIVGRSFITRYTPLLYTEFISVAYLWL